MNIGAGEAAEQVVRIILSGTEFALRLAASALKNAAALLLAMAHKRRKVYGKTSIVRLLRESRDLHCLQLTQEQFKEFRKGSKPLGILYSAVQDRQRPGNVDLILPACELGRANILLEKIRVAPDARTDSARDMAPPQQQKIQESYEKSHRERPSIEDRLKGFQAKQQKQTTPSRTKAKDKTTTKVR